MQDTIRRHGKPLGLLCLIGLCLLFVVGPRQATALEVPQYQGYVNDLAGMISPGERQRLEQMLLAFDQSDSTQIAVLTIPSLEGDALEDFSIRTVEAWKIGQKGKDNGVLLLVSKGDRKIRIEVGRGLEGVLTDLLTGRIVDQVIAPRFKAGQLDEGFEAGVSAIISGARGEFQGTGQVSRHGSRSGGQSSLFNYLIFFAILVGFLGRLSKPVGALTGAALLPIFAFLGVSSPLGWLILLLLIPGGALLGLLLPILLANAGRGGGFYMGGGGGFGGGGGGFGGFGGGGFGGGGASGSW
ncbi:MAG TPA: TPM domain-containing protein [Deltaproteobacteria bacterium]|nr:TPM domain-containing protein [Deltaproteobacteria bacterium]